MPSAPPTFKPSYNGKATRLSIAKREHDERRGSARERGYDSRWDKARRGYLRANSLCVCCQVNGYLHPAKIVDHIEPHKGDQAKFWNSENWQPLCEWCDKNIKRAVENAWLAGRLPASSLNLKRIISGWVHPRLR